MNLQEYDLDLVARIPQGSLILHLSIDNLAL